MVYRRGADGAWVLMEDDSLKQRIVAALDEHCAGHDYPWTLRILDC